MIAAVEKKDKKLGRIRLRVAPDCCGENLEQFVMNNVPLAAPLLPTAGKITMVLIKLQSHSNRCSPHQRKKQCFARCAFGSLIVEKTDSRHVPGAICTRALAELSGRICLPVQPPDFKNRWQKIPANCPAGNCVKQGHVHRHRGRCFSLLLAGQLKICHFCFVDNQVKEICAA